MDFKPLLYTTTIRNPERYKDFMHLLYKYEGQILTNDLITNFERDAFKIGLYRPMQQTDSVRAKWRTAKKGELCEIALTDKETLDIARLNDSRINPAIKGHKEAGFDYGWPSRFDTQFKLMKRFGFVYYEMGKPIRFSEIGKYMAQIVSITIQDEYVSREIVHPEYEQMAFLQSMVKEQRCNPFIQEANDNVPLILLLQTIQYINADTRFNNCGISKKELPLVIFWKDNDAKALYERIVKLREEYGYNPSDEVIEDICTNEILGGFKKFKLDSIMQEYPDDFIRKMRLTGLISLRGAGRFIDINHLEDTKIEYVLNTYKSYKKFTDPELYFNYVSAIDSNLFSLEAKAVGKTQTSEFIGQWADHYKWDKIKDELQILSKRASSSDPVLKFIPAPARLEFLTAIAIKAKYPDTVVVPNYSIDDTGLPTSTAGGNKGDIECFEDINAYLVEVTMAEGRTQTMMEVWPIERHLEEFKTRTSESSQCVFVAPSIFHDTMRQIKFVKTDAGHYIRPYNIPDFINYLETNPKLYEVAY